MFEKGDVARLEFALMMIGDIEAVIDRHGGIEKALDDFEGIHAILMCLMQAGESLNKIKDDEIRQQLPLAGIYGLRNVIAHDYEGINLKQIQETLRTHLPQLKMKISRIIETKGL